MPKKKKAKKDHKVNNNGVDDEPADHDPIGNGEAGGDDNEEDAAAGDDDEEGGADQTEKRKKRRNRLHQKLKVLRNPLTKLGGDLTKCTKENVTQYVWGLYQTVFPEKVDIELEEARLQGSPHSSFFCQAPPHRGSHCPPVVLDSFFKDCFQETHKDENYGAFLKREFPSWKKVFGKPKQEGVRPGRPVTLILGSSAIRCVGILKHLREFHEQCKIGKLFAKHFKIEEQQKVLEEEFIKLAVGTPNRLEKLVESGALKLDDLQLVVVDMVQDAKEKTIFEIPEVRKDLFLFIQNCLLPRLKEGKTKISLY